MWKKITVVMGGMALAVSLPFVALAVTTDEFPNVIMPADAATETVPAATQVQATAEVAPVEPTGPWVSPNAVDPIAIQQADQTMVRQQFRVHAETGQPEGFEPVMQRLHVDDPLGMGPRIENADQAQNMQNHQNQEMVKGNPDAPMAGAGTSECPNDGVDCPNADDPDQAMNQNQTQTQTQTQNEEMVKGNPDAPMAGAGTGDPEDCPHDEDPQGGRTRRSQRLGVRLLLAA
jgi:hypothetical protein